MMLGHVKPMFAPQNTVSVLISGLLAGRLNLGGMTHFVS